VSYSTFVQKDVNHLTEPMFFGHGLNVARYDIMKYPHVDEHFTQKELGFFWRPEEVDLSKDRIDFQGMPLHEKHIFTSNLKYQTLLDSIQGRGLSQAYGKIITLPEMESWFKAWEFFEGIHSRSYTHIIRNLYAHPGEIFDDIVFNDNISARTLDLTGNYDRFIRTVDMWSLFGEGDFTVHRPATKVEQILANLPEGATEIRPVGNINVSMPQMMADAYYLLADINVLEAIRFYVSFACSFAFKERRLMEGNAKVIQFILRDESLHKTSTTWMLNTLASGAEGQEWAKIAREQKKRIPELFITAAQQEIEWAKYLFKDGAMPGINVEVITRYIQYIVDLNLGLLDLPPVYGIKKNPMPWMNTYTNTDNVQVAPQEVEVSSYITAGLDVGGMDALSDLSL
jgi:ribonucleoside-diphosphate reductase class Ia beta subunit (EC 1.17.4.1)